MDEENRLRLVSLSDPNKEKTASMEKSECASMKEREAAALEDLLFLHVRENRCSMYEVLVASRTTLMNQSSVLALHLTEAKPARLYVTAKPDNFFILYAMMQIVEGSARSEELQEGSGEKKLALASPKHLIVVLPLAVRFGAAGVVAGLVEGVQRAPSVETISAVDHWVPDEGPLGGFAWGQPAAKLLVQRGLACSWARDDGRTYFKVQVSSGISQYKQRIEGQDDLSTPRSHHHVVLWYDLYNGPCRLRTLKVLLDRAWLSWSPCGLTRE